MKQELHVDQLTEEESTPLYTLGIASKLSGIPAHSIRQYIDMGLIIPFKQKSNRHLFSRIDIQRLKHIKSLIREKGLNFSGVRALMAMTPCWSMVNCSEDDRNSCGAYSDDFQPCWDASHKAAICKNENCRECKVYRSLDKEAGIKSLLQKYS